MMPPHDPDDLPGRITALALSQARLANAVLVLALAIKDLAQAKSGAIDRATAAIRDSDAVFDAAEIQMMGRVM